MEYNPELNTSEHYEAFRIMQVRADIAASFQRVALEHLEDRVARAAGWALEEWPGIKHLVVAGGVAANQLLRSKLQACCCIVSPAQNQHAPSHHRHPAQHISACSCLSWMQQLSIQESCRISLSAAWLTQACAGRHLQRSKGWSWQCRRQSCARTTA